MGYYSAYPDHLLVDVPDRVLDKARRVMDDAVLGNAVDADFAHPLADAVVIAVGWGTLKKIVDEWWSGDVPMNVALSEIRQIVNGGEA